MTSPTITPGEPIKLDPRDQHAPGNLARLIWLRGELAAAHQSFDEGLRTNPGNALHRDKYARFLATGRNDPNAARRLYEEGLTLDPDNETLLKGLAEVPTEESYIAAIAAAPGDADPHNNFGVFLYCVNADSVAAESEYRRALELAPGHANAAGNLAALLWQKIDDLDEAERLFRSAVDADPTNIPQRNNLAEFLRDARADPAAARSVYEAGLDLAPGSQTLREGLARLPTSQS